VTVTSGLHTRVLTAMRLRSAREGGGASEIARVLDGLHSAGWTALHGVAFGRGTVEHLAIGPGGVFLIETRSAQGRMAAHEARFEWLSRPYAQAKSLERMTGQSVEPLFVVAKGWVEPRVSTHHGVTVLAATDLAEHLTHHRRRLSPGEVGALCGRLTHALAA